MRPARARARPSTCSAPLALLTPCTCCRVSYPLRRVKANRPDGYLDLRLDQNGMPRGGREGLVACQVEDGDGSLADAGEGAVAAVGHLVDRPPHRRRRVAALRLEA